MAGMGVADYDAVVSGITTIACAALAQLVETGAALGGMPSVGILC